MTAVSIPTAGELSITRILDAPRELVFRMWSQPEHMRRWSCPQGFTQPGGGMEFKPGGAWSAHMRGPDGEDFRLGGIYKEIVPGERIVFTHAWLDAEGKPGPATLVTVTFADQGKKTRLTFQQTGFDSEASRDGHLGGWAECFDKLATYLAELQA